MGNQIPGDDTKWNRRIGILGGTFDPVHCGHLRIASSFLQSGLVDKLLILLSPIPPHKQEQEQTDFTHRLEMLKLAFREIEKVWISDMEKDLEKPSYTLQTLQYLQEKHPETLFYLCIGEDSLQHFNQWYKYEEILDRVDLIVAERPGYDRSKVDRNILEHAIFVEHQPYDISSTKIRNRKSNLNEDVPDAVADYIKEHQLYNS